MKQFIVLAYDAKDAEAPARRQAARAAHLELVTKMRKDGKTIFGMALLDDAGQMIGSMMALNFNDRAELDAWLAAEPYVTGKVWHDIKVLPSQIPPTFADLIKKD